MREKLTTFESVMGRPFERYVKGRSHGSVFAHNEGTYVSISRGNQRTQVWEIARLGKTGEQDRRKTLLVNPDVLVDSAKGTAVVRDNKTEVTIFSSGACSIISRSK